MSTYYTSKYSGEQIDEAVKKIMDGEMTGDYADRQLSNLDTPQAALANLGAGVRPNLFINYDFRIWQRYPSGTYTGIPNNEYIADGFIILSSNGDISNTFERVDGGGIKNASGPGCKIKKKLEGADSLNGQVCTMSALKSTGFFTKTVTITGASETSDIIDQFLDDPLLWLHTGETMYAIKLEQGDTQTLAYQDEDGAWQRLPQPESDYATQLAKCQRYFFRSTANHYFSGCMYDASNGVFLVPYSVEMRTAPAVTAKNSGTLRFYDNTAVALTAGNISVQSADGSGIKLFVSGVSGGKAGSATITDMQFDFSAEL